MVKHDQNKSVLRTAVWSRRSRSSERGHEREALRRCRLPLLLLPLLHECVHEHTHSAAHVAVQGGKSAAHHGADVTTSKCVLSASRRHLLLHAAKGRLQTYQR